MLALPYTTTLQSISIFRFHPGAQIFGLLGVLHLPTLTTLAHHWHITGTYTRHTPPIPFTHTPPHPRLHFNFYRLYHHFNFLPHFSATLPPIEPLFTYTSHLPTTFFTICLPFLPTPLSPFLSGKPSFYTISTLYRHYTDTIPTLYRHYMGI